MRFPISCGRYEGARGVSTDGASRLDVLPAADDQLGLIRACQDLVGGFIKVALRLPNGDAVCVNQDATSPRGYFWLPCAPLPGPGLIVGP